jgi:2-deoxy-D-gluconate 3-dehydrogenase
METAMADHSAGWAGHAALVTGAARGIGAAIATAMAGRGADVWFLDRDVSVVDSAAAANAHHIIGDVTDPALRDKALETIRDAGRSLRFFVAAAGIQVRTSALDVSPVDWARLLDTNLTGAFTMLQAATRAMALDGGGAALVITSMSGDRAIPGIVPYGATKAALAHLVRGLAVELGHADVRVNGIAPGYVRTTMTADLLRDDDQVRQILARLPLGRLAEPEDMVGPSMFLLSDEARYVTGQILGVDGGYSTT